MSPKTKPLRAVLNKVGDGARGIFKGDFQEGFSRAIFKTKSTQTRIGLQPFHQTAGMNV